MIIIFRKVGKPLPKVITTFPIPRQTSWALHLLKEAESNWAYLFPFFLYFSFLPYFSLPLIQTHRMINARGRMDKPGPPCLHLVKEAEKATVVSALDVARRDVACKSPQILSKACEVWNLYLIRSAGAFTGKFLNRWIQLEKLHVPLKMFFHLPKMMKIVSQPWRAASSF